MANYMKLTGPIRMMRCLLLFCMIFVFTRDAEGGDLSKAPVFESGMLYLGPHLEYLEDREGALTYGTITSPGFDGMFTPASGKTINLGYSRSVFWLRTTVYNTSSETKSFVLFLKESPTESVDLYVRGKVHKNGSSVPVVRRDFPGPGPAFIIDLAPQTSEEVLLRVRTDTSINLTFILFEPRGFYNYAVSRYIVILICFGILLFAITYNTFIFFYTRDISYIINVLFSTSLLLNRTIVFGFLQYLFPEGSGKWIYYLLLFSTFFEVFTISMLNINFLKIRRYNRFFFRLHSSLLIFAAACVPLIFIRGQLADKISVISLLVAVILSVMSGIYSLRLGLRSARFFLIAGALPILMTVVFTLSIFSVFSFTHFMEESLLVTATLMIVLLTLALADSIAQMQKEKELAQIKAIESQRILNQELESKVIERTAELVEERNKLERTNYIMEKEMDLARSLQQQLIPVNNKFTFISSIYYPMMQLGGDFFDFITFDNPSKIGIILCDVSGHGVSAAFITSMLKSVILQAGEQKNDPSVLLSYLNESFYDNSGGYFCTAVYCIYDSDLRTISYAIAGHERPLVIGRHTVRSLEGASSLPLGVLDNNSLLQRNKYFVTHRLQLEAGDKLFLYTDGLAEARPIGQKSQFCDVELDAFINTHRQHSCDEFSSRLFTRLIEYRGADNFEDDICYICLDVL